MTSPNDTSHAGRYPAGARAFPHRHLLAIGHLETHEILYLLDEAEQWVALNRQAKKHSDRLAGLTPRELEVLGWVTAGKTNAQIGAIVGASPRTIAKHLERVYEKLGVDSRTAAAMRASRTRSAAIDGDRAT